MTDLPAHRLAGKRAYITGAASGLGAAMAKLFARHGAKVFLTDINGDGALAQADAINAEHGATVAWAAAQNVREEAPWPTLLEQAAQAMGDAYLLPSIAAVVLGGTSILGGKGSYLGTIAGVILITLLQSILAVMQMPEAGRQIIYGVVIIVMLLLYGRTPASR